MKCFLLLLLAAVLFCGCRTRYEITLSSGNKITAITKPKLVNGFYVFKDLDGQEAHINAMRVKVVQPQSHASKESTFKAPAAK